MQIQDAGRQHCRQAQNEGIGYSVAAFQPTQLPHRNGGTGAGDAGQGGKELRHTDGQGVLALHGGGVPVTTGGAVGQEQQR